MEYEFDDESGELLDERIMELFGEMDLGEVEDSASRMNRWVTDMFSVSFIGAGVVELTHEFDDRTFYPVLVPPTIEGLLLIGDTFLMTIGQSNVGWHIFWMSTVYATVDVPEDVPEAP